MSNDIRFLVECLAKELIEMLMRDYGWDMNKAIDVFYSSDTYTKLENSNAGLYYQGAIYVYSFLKEELETGFVN